MPPVLPAAPPATGRPKPLPICPYCRARVAKVPKYKAICNRCGQTYYVRARPGESHPALVTARQAAAVDENRATQPRWKQLPTPAEAAEERSFNWFWAHSTAESQWRQQKRMLALHAREGNWLLYRNTRFDMAEVRRRQVRLREALDIYLEVWYLDLNGPQDSWGVVESRRLYETTAFQPSRGLTTPVVARWTNRLGVRLDVDRQGMERLFGEIATRLYRTLELPLTPREAWRALEPELAL